MMTWLNFIFIYKLSIFIKRLLGSNVNLRQLVRLKIELTHKTVRPLSIFKTEFGQCSMTSFLIQSYN